MFPGSGQTALAVKWANIQAASGRIRDRSSWFVDQGTIARRQVLEHHNYLLDIRADLEGFTANATTNGLLEYARAQVNNPTLDLVAEYMTMRNALDAVVNWTVTNFPNTSGELRVYTFSSSRSVDVLLTGPEMTSYKSQLSTLIATIS